MTFATLILDSLVSGLFLIALGGVLDLLQARHRRREARLRASDPFAALEPMARARRPALRPPLRGRPRAVDVAAIIGSAVSAYFVQRSGSIGPDRFADDRPSWPRTS